MWTTEMVVQLMANTAGAMLVGGAIGVAVADIVWGGGEDTTRAVQAGADLGDALQCGPVLDVLAAVLDALWPWQR